MEGSRTTPEQTLVNDGDEGTSPLKPLRLPVAGHNAEEESERTMPMILQDDSEARMYKLLGTTMGEMNGFFPHLPTLATILKELRVDSLFNEKAVTKYLNRLSNIVYEHLDKCSENRAEKPSGIIRFFDRHNIASKDHPTGTANRPDFVALKMPVEQASPSRFYWSALEATGELLSGTNKESSLTKTAAYTSYLLQARPDMVTVQGIYVDSNGFRLVVSSACGSSSTTHLKWESRPSRLLLCAWISRLYKPVVDSSITVNIEGNEAPTFNIKLPDDEYSNCRIHFAGTAFGRRTIVFACPERDVVIKEQYIETSRTFEEGSILTTIHEKGTFPGVVRHGWSGSVQPSGTDQDLTVELEKADGEKEERKKIRIILLDKAPSIMDAKTPQEVLVAMYDLLEITRFLEKKRGILHRDISCNNVLLRPVVPPTQSSTDTDQSITEELHDMCFASYLLRTKSNSSIGPTKLDTGVVFIDFDMGLNQLLARRKKALQAQTGTPIFVARAVVSCKQKRGDYTLKAMPQFDQANEADEAYKAYKDAVPERLEAFPANKTKHYEVLTDIPHAPFKHKLQYDAESVFWLLLWWAIQAYPNEESPDVNKIDDRDWDALTKKQDEKLDPRERFVKEPFYNVIHTSYQPLETLLEEMAQQLRGDHEKGEALLKEQDPEHEEDQSRKKADYLHEAFQRLIIKFLFANYNKEFMTKQKGPHLRRPKVVLPMVGGLSSAQVDRVRTSGSKTGASGGSSSRNVESSYRLRLAPPSIPSDSSSRPKRKRSEDDATGSGSTDEDPNDKNWTPAHTRRRHK